MHVEASDGYLDEEHERRQSSAAKLMRRGWGDAAVVRNYSETVKE